jgi:hypothetical protein
VAVSVVLTAVLVWPEDQDEVATGAARSYVLPAREDAVHGPGTELGDGFEVPEGARLVGRVFPDPQDAHGWSATLLLDGDPMAVYNSLTAQARAAGFGDFPWAGTSCWYSGFDNAQGEPVERDASAVSPGQRAESVSCHGVDRIPGGESFSGVMVSGYRGRDDDAYVSHLVITRAGPPPGESRGHETAEHPPPGAEVAPPDEPVTLADVGEPFAFFSPYVSKDGTSTPVLHVEQGSELVAPPAHDPLGFNGFRGVLRVTQGGDAVELVDAYSAQLADTRFGLHRRDLDTSLAGERIVRNRLTIEGGDAVAITAYIPQRPATAWLVIDHTSGG